MPDFTDEFEEFYNNLKDEFEKEKDPVKIELEKKMNRVFDEMEELQKKIDLDIKKRIFDKMKKGCMYLGQRDTCFSYMQECEFSACPLLEKKKEQKEE